MEQSRNFLVLHDSTRPFQDRMVDYIRENFTELLGENVRLLDEPGGLEKLAVLLRREPEKTRKAA